MVNDELPVVRPIVDECTLPISTYLLSEKYKANLKSVMTREREVGDSALLLLLLVFGRLREDDRSSVL